MVLNKLVLAILALGISHSVFAKTVHKCVLNGSITYQSRPCPGTVEANPQQKMQQKLAQKTATQNIKMKELAKLNQAQAQSHKYSQQQHLQQRSSNGTSNEIAETVEGKKKGLAIAQDAYQQTKNRS